MSERVESTNGDRLVSASEIARIARVAPSAVSNWQKRYSDFPTPAGTASSGGHLFRLADIETWLASHQPVRRRPKGSSNVAREQLWAVTQRLRGKELHGDVVGPVAAAAVLLDLARAEGGALSLSTTLPPSEIETFLEGVVPGFSATNDDAQRFVAPLLALDPQSRVHLLDALAAFTTSDELASALDYVLERAARYSEFRTNEAAARLLAELAVPHTDAFDPAAGAGELLIQAHQAAANNVAGESVILYGQELNQSSWRVALARLMLRRLNASVVLGDSLAEDRFPELRADVVLCEPPAGTRTPPLRGHIGDPRWQLLGSRDAPPPSASDFIWLAHVISHLSEGGRGYVLLPTGSLFRGGTEARLRAELLRQGTVEAIVTLPRGATVAPTTVALALWIVRPPLSDPPPVLLLDVSNEGQLSDAVADRVITTVFSWREAPEDFSPVPALAVTVPVLELLAGEAALVPSRWLYEPDLIDVDALQTDVRNARRALEEAHAAADRAPLMWDIVPRHESPPTIRVREMIDLGLAELVRPVNLKTDAFNDTDGVPVWLPVDINEPWRRDEPPRYLRHDLADPRSMTEPGDIVFTRIGGLRTRVDEEGGHILGTSLQGLRLRPGTSDPHAIAALLMSESNKRFLTGSVIPRVNVLELELPQLELEAARRFGDVVRNLERELQEAHAIAERAAELRAAVVDALATGAFTVSETDTERA